MGGGGGCQYVVEENRSRFGACRAWKGGSEGAAQILEAFMAGKSGLGAGVSGFVEDVDARVEGRLVRELVEKECGRVEAALAKIAGVHGHGEEVDVAGRGMGAGDIGEVFEHPGAGDSGKRADFVELLAVFDALDGFGDEAFVFKAGGGFFEGRRAFQALRAEFVDAGGGFSGEIQAWACALWTAGAIEAIDGRAAGGAGDCVMKIVGWSGWIIRYGVVGLQVAIAAKAAWWKQEICGLAECAGKGTGEPGAGYGHDFSRVVRERFLKWLVKASL